MAERNWSRTIAEILSSEGGYVNNPRDPGGPTNLGVTLANFRAFVKPDGTIADLKALTKEQAATVFRRQYWDKVQGSALPDGVDYAVTDFAVNSANKRAEELAQRIAGANIDGVIGPASLVAIHAITPAVFINQYCDARLKFLMGLSTWDTFGTGWKARVDKVRRIALEMVGQPANVETIIQPVEIEKQVPAPVIAKGADKPGIARLWAVVPLLGTPITMFGSLDNVTKAIIGGVVLVSIIALWLRGEQIAARTKQVIRDFSS